MSQQKKVVPILRTHRRKRRNDEEEEVKEESKIAITVKTETSTSVFQELLETAKAVPSQKRREAFIHTEQPMTSVTFGKSHYANGRDVKSHIMDYKPWEFLDVNETKVKVEGTKEEEEEEKAMDQELFDYESYYPTILPMRPVEKQTFDIEDDSHMILPQILGKHFSEHKQAKSNQDEISTINNHHLINSLALRNESILFQLPSVLPKYTTAEMVCHTKDIPSGLAGKLMIYKSGKIKLRLGEAVMDVGPGTRCPYEQEVVAINTEDNKGHCAFLGQICKNAVCTYDVFQLMALPKQSIVKKEEKINVVKIKKEDLDYDIRCVVKLEEN